MGDRLCLVEKTFWPRVNSTVSWLCTFHHSFRILRWPSYCLTPTSRVHWMYFDTISHKLCFRFFRLASSWGSQVFSARTCFSFVQQQIFFHLNHGVANWARGMSVLMVASICWVSEDWEDCTKIPTISYTCEVCELLKRCTLQELVMLVSQVCVLQLELLGVYISLVWPVRLHFWTGRKSEYTLLSGFPHPVPKKQYKSLLVPRDFITLHLLKNR